ncbi:MAG: iron-containing redox enzyme family protein [Candidatus Binatia bacterium]
MKTLVPRVFSASLAERLAPSQDVALGSHAQDLTGAARELGEKSDRQYFDRYGRPEEAKNRVKRNRQRNDVSITPMSWRPLSAIGSRPTFPGECSCSSHLRAGAGAATPDLTLGDAAADLTAWESSKSQGWLPTRIREAPQHMIAIASLDGLVEASQLSRTLGGVGDAVHSVLTRLLLEEYGGGRLQHKHSTYFRTMMDSLGMDATPELHFDAVPWEVLATINHSFLLSDRRRFFLRYVGGLLHTEMTIPNTFRCYVAAAERLGLPTESMSYWELHIKEDQRHGPWMLNDVAIPLAQRYPAQAWELVLGYDQQERLSARAGQATARACMLA